MATLKTGSSKEKKPKKPLSFKEATGGKTDKGKVGYSRMTEDEREEYKVAHGVAPTAADPSKVGMAERAEALVAKSKGQLSDKEIRAKKTISAREIDEAKYNAGILSAETAKVKLALKEKKEKSHTGIMNSDKLNKGSKRSSTNNTERRNSQTSSNQAKKMKSASNFGFGNVDQATFTSTQPSAPSAYSVVSTKNPLNPYSQ